MLWSKVENVRKRRHFLSKKKGVAIIAYKIPDDGNKQLYSIENKAYVFEWK